MILGATILGAVKSGAFNKVIGTGKRISNAFRKAQNAKNKKLEKFRKFAKKKNEQINKVSPLPQPKQPTFNQPKFNVGGQLNAFKKKQALENNKIGKQLGNPISYENKIKQIMGVN